MNIIKNLLFIILTVYAVVFVFIDPVKSLALTAIAFLLAIINFEK